MSLCLASSAALLDHEGIMDDLRQMVMEGYSHHSRQVSKAIPDALKRRRKATAAPNPLKTLRIVDAKLRAGGAGKSCERLSHNALRGLCIRRGNYNAVVKRERCDASGCEESEGGEEYFAF